MNNTNDDFGVLLIDPGIQLKTKQDVKYVNRGLLSIATFLESKGIKINYFALDHYYMNEGMDEDEVFAEIKRIIQEKNIKLCGISNLFFAETSNTLKIADFIKENSPETITVIGGYNPTINDQEIIENKGIDYVIKGEGEWSLHDLIVSIRDGKSTNDIPGLISKEHIGPQSKHGDLNELPPLDYSILPKEYLFNKNPPRINLELSRGCYHDCSFCIVSQFWQKTIRSHEPLKLIHEFQQLKEIGYKGEFTMEEATINLKSERVKEFLRKARQFKDDFSFDYIATRYDFIDEESLGLLDEIGFKNMIFGLESVAKVIQDKINKHIDLDKFTEACRTVRKFKIKLSFFMIIGLPGETHETYKETYNFLSKLLDEGLLDSVFPCYFQPYRGTKAKEDLKEIGGTILAEEKDYFRWLMRDRPLIEYKNLNATEMKGMMERMLRLNEGKIGTPIEKIR